MNGASSEAFPRSHRLLTEKDFRRVLALGHRQGTPHLVVHLLVQDLPNSRLGLTIPRKVGTAVVRNRVRRRLREIFRRGLRRRLGEPCADLVIAVTPPAAGTSLAELAGELEVAVDAWLARGRPGRKRRGP